MEIVPFENVKNQVGFCGIWCGSCLGGNGAVLDLTRKYEQTIKHSRSALEKWGPKEFNFNELMKQLAFVRAIPNCPGCRKGGGNSTCKVRICALSRGETSCGPCGQLSTCGNFEELEKSNPKIKEDLAEIRNNGEAALIKKWTSDLKAKWPNCLLLCESVRK